MMRLIELKDTFVGKALAVFVSILLATSLINVAAFATGQEENSTTPYQESIDDRGTGAESADVSSANAAQEVSETAQPAAQEPAAQPAVEEPTSSEPAAETEPAAEESQNNATSNNEQGGAPASGDSQATTPAAQEQDKDQSAQAAPADATVKLKLDNASLVIKSDDNKKVASDKTSVKVDAQKKLEFKAVAADGYTLDTVKAQSNAAEIQLTEKADDTYVVDAANVADGLEIDVTTEVVKDEEATEEESATEEGSEGATEEGAEEDATESDSEEATEGEEATEEEPTPEEEAANEVADEAANAMESAAGAIASVMMLKASTPVDVQLRLYNTDNQVDEIIPYTFAGNINATTAPTVENVSELAGYHFTDATVDDANGNRTEIKYVESQNGATFYAFIEDPTYGVGLAEGETIYLNYMADGNTVPVNVNTSGEDDVEGNAVDAAERATKGSDFSFNVSTARGYTAEVTVNGESVKSDTGAYTTRIAENADAVQISVNFVADESVSFDPGVFNQRNYKYLFEGGSEDTYGAEGGTNGTPRFTSNTLNIQEESVGSDGAGFTFEFTTNGDWQCDSFQINGTYIQIPQTRTEGASAQTVLYSDGTGECVATFALTSIRGENATYRLTITGAKEDLTITAANLNGGGWSEVIPTATEGVWFKSSASQNGRLEDGGLNEPYATAGGGTPKFQFGLDEGYKNLAVDIIGYTGDDEVAYQQSVDLPRAGQSESIRVEYRYWKPGWFGGSSWQTGTATVATITGNRDGSYTIQYTNNQEYNEAIELQFLEITCELATYGVVYNPGSGTNAPIDSQSYDVVSNSTAVVASGSPKPPAGKQFSGWDHRGR